MFYCKFYCDRSLTATVVVRYRPGAVGIDHPRSSETNAGASGGDDWLSVSTASSAAAAAVDLLDNWADPHLSAGDRQQPAYRA